MNNVDFTKEAIVDVIDKLKKTREDGHFRAYKTLTDSLQTLISSSFIKRDYVKKEESFLTLLDYHFDKEITEVKTKVKQTINAENYKEHHDWLLSLDRLLRQKKSISGGVNLKYCSDGKILFNNIVGAPNFNDFSEIVDTSVFCSIVSNSREESVKCFRERFYYEEVGNQYKKDYENGKTPRLAIDGEKFYYFVDVLDFDERYVDGYNKVYVSKDIDFRKYVVHIDPLLHDRKYIAIV